MKHTAICERYAACLTLSEPKTDDGAHVSQSNDCEIASEIFTLF